MKPTEFDPSLLSGYRKKALEELESLWSENPQELLNLDKALDTAIREARNLPQNPGRQPYVGIFRAPEVKQTASLEKIKTLVNGGLVNPNDGKDADKVRQKVPVSSPKPSESKPVTTILTACNTGLASGLSTQIIAKLNRMVKSPLLVEVKHRLVEVSGLQINPYLQPQAAAALTKAAAARNRVMKINSMLRTPVQQAILYEQFQRGLCNITAAAAPGRSNHERGLAIDIEDPDGWEPFLTAQGWSRLGPWDYPHYDFWNGRQDISSMLINAFQQLWNEHNPKDLIAVDGVYGPMTAQRILAAPTAGW
jgi:hypothetical protein